MKRLAPPVIPSAIARLCALALLAAPAAAAAVELVGAEACRVCHPHAYEAWRESPHARAEAALPEASRKEARCTSCHAPDRARGLAAVSCETCHGAGGFYAVRYVMRDKELSRAVGLLDPGEKSCGACHTESTPSLTRFEYASKLAAIEHWEAERAARKKAAAPEPAAPAVRPATGRRER